MGFIMRHNLSLTQHIISLKFHDIPNVLCVSMHSYNRSNGKHIGTLYWLKCGRQDSSLGLNLL